MIIYKPVSKKSKAVHRLPLGLLRMHIPRRSPLESPFARLKST